MSNSVNLGLPFLDAAQSQKHVTHNDALSMLDGIVQLGLVDLGVNAPPATPNAGDRYIVGGAPTGAFAGQAGRIACFQDGAWRFFNPQKGWIAYVASQSVLRLFDGTAWVLARGEVIQNLPLLGVNATADTTNRLAVKSPALLFDHVGNGVQFKINKNAATDTASLLYQTGYSGRAEAGLAGDDHYRVKVSADGITWRQSIDIDPATGIVSFPSGLSGVTGSSGAVMRAVTGVPSASLGNNGDFAIDSTASVLYGPKAAGVWPAGVSLTGARGNGVLNGTGAPAASTGLSGDFYLDTAASRIYGPKTATGWPATGVLLTGPQGPAGANGTGSVTSISSGTGLTGGPITTAGTLSIAANGVTNALSAQMPGNSFKANNLASAANPADLTAAQAAAMLPAVIGDTGSGGTKGLVPAPSAGDAAAGKFLSASGVWASPLAGGGTAQISAPVPQCALYGPNLANNVPNFLPAVSASLVLSAQNISTANPLIITSGNGWGPAGRLDTVYQYTANPSWTVPGAGTCYLLANTQTGATIVSALAPIEQSGGAISTVSGQYTFDIAANQMWLGNGTSATKASVVKLAECTASATAITGTTAYAYMGQYDSGYFAVAAAGQYVKSHNIGCRPSIDMRVADDATGLNERIPVISQTCGCWYGTSTKNTMTVNALSGGVSLTTGGAAMASGYYRMIARRGW